MKVGEIWVNVNVISSASTEDMHLFCGMFSADIEWKISRIEDEIIYVITCATYPIEDRNGLKLCAKYRRPYFIENFRKVYK